MYYQERFTNGDWYWRDTPTGEWQLCPRETLLQKIAELENQVREYVKASLPTSIEVAKATAFYGPKGGHFWRML